MAHNLERSNTVSEVEMRDAVLPPGGSLDWVALLDGPLPVAQAQRWAYADECGAVVTFAGTVRDHAPGRPSVSALEYEVHPEAALPRLAAVAAAARHRWPMVGRLVLLHRQGVLTVGEESVLVVVSTPHRREAFAATEYCIDTIKRTVPIWKLETWAGGQEWSACHHPIEDVAP